MRLALSNVYFAPQSIGGATRVVEDNIADFQRKGVADIGVFCSLRGGQRAHETRHYKALGAQVMAVAAPIVENADFVVSDEKMADRFGGFVDHFCPDIIHFHCIQRLTSDIALRAKQMKIPYVITMHDGWWISDRQFLINDAEQVESYDYTNPDATRALFGDRAVARQLALQEVLDGAAAIYTVSETFKGVIEQAGLDDIIVTPNGIREKAPLPKDTQSHKVTIGYLAGAAHYKGYHRMRAAFCRGRYSNLKLTIVDHSLRMNESISEVWGHTEVERIGFIPQSQVDTLYARLNVVMVPSIWPESFGLVAREALQAKSWLLASNRGAAAEDVIEGENGHIFDPTDATDFARILSLLNDDPTRYRGAPSLSDIYDASSQADQLLGEYERILTKST